MDFFAFVGFSPILRKKTEDRRYPARYGLPNFASLGLILVGIEIFQSETIAIYGLVFVITALLFTGSWNAWLLLVDA